MKTTRDDGSDLDARELVPVYVLAGGKSRRFGSDKASALHDGVPLVVAVVDLLRPVAASVTIVASNNRAFDGLGLRTIGDVVPDKGPLGGLLTAIEDLRGDGWLFLSACDWIGAKLDWVRALLAHRRSGAEAILYKSDRLEPLFALYRGSIGPAVRVRLDHADLSMRGLLAEIDAEVIPAPSNWSQATNLNRPDENGLQK